MHLNEVSFLVPITPLERLSHVIASKSKAVIYSGQCQEMDLWILILINAEMSDSHRYSLPFFSNPCPAGNWQNPDE
jgi:hypothetical protein